MKTLFGVPVIRRYDLLEQLLASLTESEVKPDRVVVVDNGCKIGETQLPEHVEVIAPGRNVGVSGAWNYLFDACAPDDVLIVSNDDVCLKPYSLTRLLELTPTAELVEGPSFSMFAVTGECRRIIGGFDENFWPAYFEDNDYALRMKLAGLKQVRAATDIGHVGSASLHCLTDKQQAEFGKHFAKLSRYYLSKWGGEPTKEKFTQPFNGKIDASWTLRPVTQGGRCNEEWWLKA